VYKGYKTINKYKNEKHDFGYTMGLAVMRYSEQIDGFDERSGLKRMERMSNSPTKLMNPRNVDG
jgi:hypothetical protein